ncbi:hypothetical protein GCM10027446_01040 [Angustibacter peucedani]
MYLPRLGGIERQVADLAAQQRLRGDDVHVLTSTDGAAAHPDVTRSPFADARVSRVIDTLCPDVVHCHSSVVSPLAWSAARQAAASDLPTVVTMHSVAQRTWPVTNGLRAVAALVGPGVTWTAVSRVAADALVHAIGRPVRVLPNGVDPTAWQRADVGVRDVLTVASVMRLAARKRPMAFVDVLELVDQQLAGRVPWRAVIAGSGPQTDAVAREVRRRGLQDVVLLAGRLDRPSVADLLASADLYVAPALMESFGIAALEARCAGLPVVGYRGAGVAEFVEPGVHGELVADDAEMACVVADLLGDRLRLRHLATGARRPVPQSWDAVVARCAELYELAACQTATSRPATAVT